MKAKDANDIDHARDNMPPLLVVSGCMRPVMNNEQKERLAQDLLNFRVQKEMESFAV